jgi:hypothetical protein
MSSNAFAGTLAPTLQDITSANTNAYCLDTSTTPTDGAAVAFKAMATTTAGTLTLVTGASRTSNFPAVTGQDADTCYNTLYATASSGFAVSSAI